jgi:murein DD-endopeptidase MepM/ murein hydrolase activator NlpD
MRSARDRLRPFLILVILLLGCLGAALAMRLADRARDPLSLAFLEWQHGNAEARSRLVTVGRESCPGAPFSLPADGFIGLLYGDPRGPYSQSRPHQGIDIFSPGEVGETPVYAAYDGYITREPDWRSTLIQRVPDDPLQPGRQIWLYYTHMADRSGERDTIEDAFEPGTRELFVSRGTLLGTTGNYSGDSLRPVGVHLHFSIVLDRAGEYLNELEFENTIDPSRYLGMAVNYGCASPVPGCAAAPLCAEALLGGGG